MYSCYYCSVCVFLMDAVLDWRSCKDVAITAKNGVEVKQPPPAYPVSCTAACYVARTQADSVTTPDYMQVSPY